MSEYDDSVVIFQDWNERNGKIYYRWRFEGEKKWHEKLTALKQKPYIKWVRLSEAEVNDLELDKPLAKSSVPIRKGSPQTKTSKGDK